MNYFELHIGDYTAATAHLSWDEDMAYTRLIRAYYHAERGIPDDQRHRLARATSPAQRKAVDTVLSEFFVLTDGVWVQKRCEEEIARYRESQVDQLAKRDNEKERQRRSRERRKQMFDQLREHGVVPAWDTPTNELEKALSRVTGAFKSRPVTPPVTRDNTATQTPITKHQEEEKEEARALRLPPSVDLLTGAGVATDVARDWLAVRKAKRAGPVTQTVLLALERESRKAGIAVADAVRICVERGWQGFDASWNWQGSAAAPKPAAIPKTSFAETDYTRGFRGELLPQFAAGGGS